MQMNCIALYGGQAHCPAPRPIENAEGRVPVTLAYTTIDGVEHRDFASYDYADDAARQNWGGNWRTPTDAEWTWLREHCTWTWTNRNINL